MEINRATWLEAKKFSKLQDDHKKPFPCPNLYVPESDITIFSHVNRKPCYELGGDGIMHKGDLVCCPRMGGDFKLCSMKGVIKKLDSGRFEVTCAWNSSKFRFKIEDFKEKEK